MAESQHVSSDAIELCRAASGGIEPAFRMLVALISVAHTWDDLIDRDRRVDDEAINRAFYNALVAIPLNPFYQQHHTALGALIANAVRSWRLANEKERHPQDKGDLLVAFVLRSAFVDLISFVAYATQGEDVATDVARRARAMAHAEGFDGYLRNLARELEIRMGGTSCA